MKKLAAGIIAIVCFFAVSGNAVIWKQRGQLKVYVPLTTLNLVSLYDTWNGQGLWGGETPILGWGDRLNFNYGFMSTTPQEAKEGDGTPYYSLDYDLLQVYPTIINYIGIDNDLRVGIFAGYAPDLKKIVNGKEITGNWRAGIKAGYKFDLEALWKTKF